MRRQFTLYGTSVGKKAVMAVSGLLLFGFVLGHMAGNLKAFQGPEKFNAYAEFLREVGYPIVPHSGLLWVMRLGLVAVAVLHIGTAIRLTLAARAARPAGYRRPVHMEQTYASRTMVWGGIIVLLFAIYHILHITLGVVSNPGFRAGDAYHNLVGGLAHPLVAVAYMVAVGVLAVHLYHGLWSLFQSLGLNNPRYNAWRRRFAVGMSALIFVGFISVPVAILTGIIR